MSKKITLILSGLGTFVLLFILLNTKGDLQIFDEQFIYTKSYVVNHLYNIGSDGRATYKSVVLVDFIYMFFYTSFLLGLFSLTFKNTSNIHISSLPILVLIADLIETTTVYYLLVQYPDINKFLLWVLVTTTPIKWTLLFICIIILIYKYIKRFI